MEKDSVRKIMSILLFTTLIIQSLIFFVQADTTDRPVISSLTSSQKSEVPDDTSSDLSDPSNQKQNLDTGTSDDSSNSGTGTGGGTTTGSSGQETNQRTPLWGNHQFNLKNILQNILMKLNLCYASIHEKQRQKEEGYTNPGKNITDPDDHSHDIPDPGNTHPDLSSQQEKEPISVSYEYPRLSLGTYWLQDWLTKINPQTGRPYGLQWLYQFQNIYTVTLTSEALNVQQAAREDGHADWVRNTTFIYMDCFFDAYNFTDLHPPTWDYGYAYNSPGKAIDIAIYKNDQLGCDWWLRDIHGQKIWLWSEGKSWAWDSTPGCPLGLWDGNYTYEGHTYCLGDTRGLTMAQWICGPFKEHVIEHSLFAQVFDGIQSEDYLTAWLYTFRNQIPDPLRDGTGMNYNQLTDYCRDTWNYITVNFWGDLARHGFITRLNGNGLRWRGDGYQNDWPAWQESFSGCKFEDCFKWGGWPRYDVPMYWNCYNWVEQFYHPLPNTPENDPRQGWDVTTIQVNAENDWSQGGREKFKRFGLAFTLMGDGYADCYASMNDYYFAYYLRIDPNNQSNAPEGIPEMSFKLGHALGDYNIFIPVNHASNPLYYRQFHNNDTGNNYTVVLNIWNIYLYVNNIPIPAQDGVWFEGDWPYGDYQRIIFE